jgi:hypothetical protein
MFVVHDFHLGFSTPTDEYGSKEKVEATKLQESPLPAQSPVIITGKQFLSLYSLMCLQIYKYFCYYYSYNLLSFSVSTLSNKNNQLTLPDTNRLSKKHLQNYARKNNLDPPVFTIKTERLHYKATVVIDEKSFESPTFCNSIKEAEQAAAKIALRELPISVDLFKKVSVLEISYVIPN